MENLSKQPGTEAVNSLGVDRSTLQPYSSPKLTSMGSIQTLVQLNPAAHGGDGSTTGNPDCTGS
jgi:hypothetical protein